MSGGTLAAWEETTGPILETRLLVPEAVFLTYVAYRNVTVAQGSMEVDLHQIVRVRRDRGGVQCLETEGMRSRNDPIKL